MISSPFDISPVSHAALMSTTYTAGSKKNLIFFSCSFLYHALFSCLYPSHYLFITFVSNFHTLHQAHNYGWDEVSQLQFHGPQ